MQKQEYEIITAIIVFTIILVGVGIFIITLVTYNNRKKKRYLEEKEQMKISFDQEMLRTQLEIQEQTLKVVSQEIHDNIGQILSLAKLNLATADFQKVDSAKQKVDDSKILVAKAIQDLRDLSKGLNPENLKGMGLVASIQYQVAMIQKLGIFDTKFETVGTVTQIDDQKELILYRIVQECLSNIIRHSMASEIQISLTYLADELILRIYDNGVGIATNPDSFPSHGKSGIGLRNIKNRVKLINATLEIENPNNRGTSISVSVPLKPTE